MIKKIVACLSLLSCCFIAQHVNAADQGDQTIQGKQFQNTGVYSDQRGFGSDQGVDASAQGQQPQARWVGNGPQWADQRGGYAYDGRDGGCPADHPVAGAAQCDQPCGDCYCLYCHYQPKYYCTYRCEYEPKYCYKKCCRYVPQYYQQCCCRYVPQYYYKTCCRQVPQYYYTCECNYCKKYVPETHCKYEPCYYYKHTAAPTCTPNSCSPVNN